MSDIPKLSKIHDDEEPHCGWLDEDGDGNYYLLENEDLRHVVMRSRKRCNTRMFILVMLCIISIIASLMGIVA